MTSSSRCTLPFTPVLSWGTWPVLAATGLGDLLVAVLWPLVVAKAYTLRAAAAAAAMVGSFVVIFTLILAHVLHGATPAIALIGPVVLLHHRWLVRRHPREQPMAVHLARRAAASAQ
ncbi:hypothetical protein ACNAW0_28165 [Micromonospora sp. SL1-18]|uniref:hypothetical protein n=1 Tax=Micromonospora sp. SL1-18 TaxID=3399128 RepID=UPI003A4D6B09